MNTVVFLCLSSAMCVIQYATMRLFCTFWVMAPFVYLLIMGFASRHPSRYQRLPNTFTVLCMI